MTPADEKYEKKIAEVGMINSESEFVDSIMRFADFGNKWVMRTGAIEVKFREHPR